MQDGNEPAARGAVRLIFERNGDALRLVLQQPVDVTVARFDVQADVRPGHYVEIRDAAGMTLSRVPVRSAFSGSREGPAMTTADGSVIGKTQIFGSAPASHAFNVVLLAEGFTTAQQAHFNTACTVSYTHLTLP